MAQAATEQSNTRLVFGGYVLVAAIIAWLSGIALRAIGPLAALDPFVWGLLAAASLALAWIVSFVVQRVTKIRGESSLLRYVLVAGVLACVGPRGLRRLIRCARERLWWR